MSVLLMAQLESAPAYPPKGFHVYYLDFLPVHTDDVGGLKLSQQSTDCLQRQAEVTAYFLSRQAQIDFLR